MRTLWRNTASILRQYPILWLPLAAADLINFGLTLTERRLQHNLIFHIVSWLSQSHSVLSSAPVYADPPPYTTWVAIILTTPITWATYFLSAVLYTSAMLVTTAILTNLAESRQSLPRAAFSTLSSCRRILVFSLKLCGIFVVSLPVMGLLLIPAFWLQRYLERTPYLPLKFQLQLQHVDLLGYVIELPIVIAIAWIITPMALKLLRPSVATPTPQAKREARIAALIVVAVACTLEIFLPRVTTAYLQQINPASLLLVYIARSLTSLVAAVPYVVLYIALYLIAHPESPLIPTSESPLDLPSPPQSPPSST